MGFIFITVLVDVIGWGLIIPVMPRLIATMKHIPLNEASKDGGNVAGGICAYAVYVCTRTGQPK